MKSSYVYPKTGANHVLFGTRYKKQHNMSDPNWTAADKILQYRAMASIHEKNNELLMEGNGYRTKSSPMI